jgi:hypothetical protein
MEPKIKTIVQYLYSGTVKGKLAWETTERKTEYRLQLGNGSVTVDHWSGPDQHGDEFDKVDIRFYNGTGEMLENFDFDRATQREDYRTVLNLHDCVRRSVVKFDETLDSILGDLKSKVGDDVPF